MGVNRYINDDDEVGIYKKRANSIIAGSNRLRVRGGRVRNHLGEPYYSKGGPYIIKGHRCGSVKHHCMHVGGYLRIVGPPLYNSRGHRNLTMELKVRRDITVMPRH